MHRPSALQVSPTVHASPSSQPAPAGRGTHPPAGSHAPVRQEPAHCRAVPATHTGAAPSQWSPTVQGSPSSHAVVAGSGWQPMLGSH